MQERRWLKEIYLYVCLIMITYIILWLLVWGVARLVCECGGWAADEVRPPRRHRGRGCCIAVAVTEDADLGSRELLWVNPLPRARSLLLQPATCLFSTLFNLCRQRHIFWTSMLWHRDPRFCKVTESQKKVPRRDMFWLTISRRSPTSVWRHGRWKVCWKILGVEESNFRLYVLSYFGIFH